MKNISCSLNNVKSRYFMLLACLSLLLATTSCNNDELEFNDPQPQKQYTKAELIEQALSRIPKTRAGGERDIIVTMVTIQDAITINCSVNDTVIIDVDGRVSITLTKNQNFPPTLSFSPDYPSHYVTIMGTEESLDGLDLSNAGLISLKMYSNSNLTDLYCKGNHLDEIDLTRCPNLSYINLSDNELSSIDVTNLSYLESFTASNNRLTNIYFNNNQYMYELFVENNQLTELDLSGITDLSSLTVQNNPLKKLILKDCLYVFFLNISSTSLKSLDLSNNTEILVLLMENTSIEVLNNQSVSNMSFSFAVLEKLSRLNVANTPFKSLDLSHNPRIYSLDISGSTVTQVNLSNTVISYLCATRSKLTNLICEEKLKHLSEVRIESTPWEKDPDKMVRLGELLPDRDGMAPGHLYTYSLYIDSLRPFTNSKNWLINR